MTAPSPILRNFWLKFFSVALAAVIWLTIHYGIRNELSINHLNINRIVVPVAVIVPPGDPRVFKLIPPEVVVFAIGDITALRRDVRASVDLTYFHGRQNLSQEVRIDAPPEINVLETTPATIAVEQVVPHR
jgi:hypothetical protein